MRKRAIQMRFVDPTDENTNSAEEERRFEDKVTQVTTAATYLLHEAGKVAVAIVIADTARRIAISRFSRD